MCKRQYSTITLSVFQLMLEMLAVVLLIYTLEGVILYSVKSKQPLHKLNLEVIYIMLKRNFLKLLRPKTLLVIGLSACLISTPVKSPIINAATTDILVNLNSYYNEDSFSYDSKRNDGNFDQSGYTYSADLTPSSTTYNNISYQLGPFSNGVNNTIKGSGQTINLNQVSNYSINILAAASGGNQTGTLRINYTDSTFTDVSITIRDWCRAATGDVVALSQAHRHSQTADNSTKTYIYVYTLTPTSGKTIQSITLPNNSYMHLFAITLKQLPTPTLSRASRVLIDKGIQFHAWITTDDTGRAYPTANEYRGINFTGATYYEPDLYNDALHAAVPETQWNLAKAPFCTNAVGKNPANNSNWLTPVQQANASKCVSICFGDEQGYSTAEEGYLKNWFDLTHLYYPDILCHTNQYTNQWSSSQLDSYMRNAKPDLLTLDNYYFGLTNATKDYAIPGKIMDTLNTIRPKALAGYDGSGTSPIAFGQYLLGFTTDSGPYYITESQTYLVPNITLAMGGKWLDLFRWEYGSTTSFILFDQNRNPTSHYYDYAEVARQTKNLGPHLVRLNNTDVRILPGSHLNSSTPVENSLPNTVQRFAANSNYYISSISAQNLGTENNGLAGDVVIGYFSPLPGIDTSTFFTSTNPRYFMVCNALTSGNGLAPQNQHGSCLETKQKVTITFDIGSYSPTKLKKVSRDTGNIENVTLTPVSGTIYKLELTLGGGQAELLFWE